MGLPSTLSRAACPKAAAILCRTRLSGSSADRHSAWPGSSIAGIPFSAATIFAVLAARSKGL